MHCSPIISLVIAAQFVLSLEQSIDSSFYFPDDKVANAQVYYNNRQSIQISTSELESLRGTSTYEKYVNEIIAHGVSRLTVTVNKLLTTQPIANNVVFSPISITVALALVLLGANGITFNEISQFMGLESGIPDLHRKSQIVHEQFSRIINHLVETGGFSLGEHIDFATAVFVQTGYPIRPLYKSTAEALYKSNILNMDFQNNPALAQVEVNRWVEKHTNGKIKNILNDLPSSETKVILASALYFNAEWETHFFFGSSKKRPFFMNGRNSPSLHEVVMMSNGGDFPYYKDMELGCEILGLPYKGRKSTMYIVMPFDSSKEVLHRFELKLTEKDLERLVGNTRETGAVILFPKMKIESTIDLKGTLEQLGVKSLFDPQQANLALLSPGDLKTRVNIPSINTTEKYDTSTTKSQPQGKLEGRIEEFENQTQTESIPFIDSKISSLDYIRQLINEQSIDNHHQNPGLYAEQVIHKVYMDITEKGTEAAAATSVSLTRDGGRVTFRVDVPFFFFIRHEETKTILFWGSVVLPSSSN